MEVTRYEERYGQNTKAIDMLAETEDLGTIHASRVCVRRYE